MGASRRFPPGWLSDAIASGRPPTAVPSGVQQRMLVEQAMFVSNSVTSTVVGSALAIGLMALLLSRAVPGLGTVLSAWVAFGLLQVVARLAVQRHALRTGLLHADPARYLRRTSIGLGIGGAAWGAAWLAFVPLLPPLYAVIYLFAVFGLVAAALFGYGVHRPAFLAFAIPIVAPMLAAALLPDSPIAPELALGAVVGLGSSLPLVERFARTFRITVLLRYENDGLVEQLVAQRDAARAANLAKSRFLATASHDLRQPLHSMNLFVDVLDDEPMTPRGRQLVASLRQCMGYMNGMFGALLDVSRLDSDRLAVAPADVDLAPLLLRLAAEFEPAARARELAFRTRVPERLPGHVDPALLERVLRNLLSNALKYTERGGVLLAASRRGAEVCLSVVDTGIGIPVRMQQAVFDEFVQAHAESGGRRAGLGLGLAIVRRLTDVMGIAMRFASRPGHGTRFVLRLPAAASVPDAPAGPAGPVDAIGTRPLADRLVLLIDDEPVVLAATRAILEHAGARVCAAVDVDAAIAQCTRWPTRPDIVVTDWRLGNGSDGFDAIDRLCDEFNADLPWLLVTGDTAAERVREISERAGSHRVLYKPVTAAELVRAVASALASRRQAENPPAARASTIGAPSAA